MGKSFVFQMIDLSSSVELPAPVQTWNSTFSHLPELGRKNGEGSLNDERITVFLNWFLGG